MLNSVKNLILWRRPRLILRLVLTAVVLMAIMVVGISIWRDYRLTDQQARLALRDRASMLQQHAAQALGPVHASLDQMHALLQQMSDEDLAAGAAKEPAAKLVRASGTFSIWVADKEGRVVVASNYPSLPPVNLSTRSYFAEAQQSPGSVIVTPVTSEIGKINIILLLRSLNGPDGRFRGIVMASAHSNVFGSLYSSLRRNGSSAIGLFRDDGLILFRDPAPADGVQQSRLLADLLKQGPAGLVTGESSIDGTQRYIAWSRLQGLPVVIGASSQVEEVLFPWRERTKWTAGQLIILVLLIGLLGAAADRLLARQERQSAALDQAENHTRLALEMSPVVLFALDADLRYAWLRNSQLGLGQSMVGQRASDVFEPESVARLEAVYRRALAEGRQVTPPMPLVPVGKDRPIWFEIMAEPLQDGGLIVAAMEVTARVEHEQELERTLAQRNVLLEEVHHRVKNNLQIIQSLLTMESLHASPDSRSGYERSLGRIQAMGLVHSLLYRSGEFGSLDAGDYVQALARALAPCETIAKVTVEADPVRLPLDRAVPFGMIVNEAICNALKYACEGGGAITVQISRAERRLIVRVRDQGPGFPAKIRRTGSLGVKLMSGLAAQLDGTVSFANRSDGAGAEVLLDIPLEVAPTPLPDRDAEPALV